MMIIYLIGFSQLCILYATWENYKKLKDRDKNYFYMLSNIERHAARTDMFVEAFMKRTKKELLAGIRGQAEKYHIKAKIAEKTADRALSMASASTQGVLALQKALATPRIMTKQQSLRNVLAKKEVDEIFEKEDMFSWMRPVLGEDENELLDKVLEAKEKREYNNGQGDKIE